MGLCFVHFILPNWLPIIIAYLFLSKLSGIRNEIIKLNTSVVDLKESIDDEFTKLNTTVGRLRIPQVVVRAINKSCFDVSSTIYGISKEDKHINAIVREDGWCADELDPLE